MATYQQMLDDAISKKDTNTVQKIISAGQTAKEGTPLYQASQDAKSWMSAVGVYQAPSTNTENTTTGNIATSTQNQVQTQVPGQTPTQTPSNGLGNTSTNGGLMVQNNGQMATSNQQQAGVQTIPGNINTQPKTTNADTKAPIGQQPPQPTALPNNALKSVSDNLGYTPTFDPTTGIVTVKNNYTGKTISFANGQGKEFGMGGVQNGYNVVSNVNTLKNVLGSANLMDYEKQTQTAKEKNNFGTMFDQSMQEMGLGTILEKVSQQSNDMKIMVTDFAKQMTTAYTQLQNQMAQNAQIINQAFGNGFSYNPISDNSLQSALKYAENKLKQTLIGRGMLYSTQGKDDYGQILSDLIPKYEELAYEKYVKNVQMQMQRAEALGQLSQNNFAAVNTFANNILNMSDKVNDNTLNSLKEMVTIADKSQAAQEAQEKAALEKQKEEYTKALNRLNINGYIQTKEDALLLGLSQNTPSQKARELAQQKIDDIDKALFEASIRTTDRLVSYDKLTGAMQFQSEVNNAGKINAAVLLANMQATMSPNQWDKYINTYKDQIMDKIGNAFPDFVEAVQKLKQQSVENYYKDQANQRSWESNQRSAEANIRAGQRLEFDMKQAEKKAEEKQKEDEATKKFGKKLSYNEVDTLLKTTIQNYENSKNQYIKDNRSWERSGSVEAQTLSNIVMQSGRDLTGDQKEALFRKYNIPIVGE